MRERPQRSGVDPGASKRIFKSTEEVTGTVLPAASVNAPLNRVKPRLGRTGPVCCQQSGGGNRSKLLLSFYRK